jgi:hypothetical protein
MMADWQGQVGVKGLDFYCLAFSDVSKTSLYFMELCQVGLWLHQDTGFFLILADPQLSSVEIREIRVLSERRVVADPSSPSLAVNALQLSVEPRFACFEICYVLNVLTTEGRIGSLWYRGDDTDRDDVTPGD